MARLLAEVSDADALTRLNKGENITVNGLTLRVHVRRLGVSAQESRGFIYTVMDGRPRFSYMFGYSGDCPDPTEALDRARKIADTATIV